MLFQNEDESLELTVFNYELPAGEGSGDEPNWLVLRCTWKRDGKLTKDSNSCILTYELQEMAAGLKVLGAGIKSSYESDFMQPYFSLAAYAEGEDAFRFGVSFYLPNTMDGDDTAEVSCTMTGAELKALIGELDRMIAKFPDRVER